MLPQLWSDVSFSALVLSCFTTLVLVILLLACVQWRKWSIFSGFTFGRLHEGVQNPNEAASQASFPTSFNPDTKVAFDTLPEIEICIPGSEDNIIVKSLRPKIYTEKLLQNIDTDKEIKNILTSIDSKFHIDKSSIQPGSLIGKSLYGEVFLVTTKDKNVFIQCVLTSLLEDENVTPITKLNFWKELSAYREIRHKNVLSFLKVNVHERPHCSLLEYCHLGDLKSYLSVHSVANKSSFQNGLLLKFALDIATGLDVIHNHKYVHRDLAARNCLVTSDLTVKIGDYGLAEEKFPVDYFKWQNYMFPIRWMAPESIHFDGKILKLRKLTKLANIWSFGIVVTELMTFGQLPFPELNDEEVLSHASQKTLKLQSSTCTQTDKLEPIRHACLNDASKRPNLQTIINQLCNLKESRSTTVVDVLRLNETLSNSGSPCELIDVDDAFAAESVANDNFSFNTITLSIEPATDDMESDDYDEDAAMKKKIPINIFDDINVIDNEEALQNEKKLYDDDLSKKSLYAESSSSNVISLRDCNVTIENFSESTEKNKKLISVPTGMLSEVKDDMVENLYTDGNNFSGKGCRQLIVIHPNDIHCSDQGSDTDVSSGRSSKMSFASKIVNVDEGSLSDNNSKLLRTLDETNKYFSLNNNEEVDDHDPANKRLANDAKTEHFGFSDNFSDAGVTLMADDNEDERVSKISAENIEKAECEPEEQSGIEDDDIDDTNINEKTISSPSNTNNDDNDDDSPNNHQHNNMTSIVNVNKKPEKMNIEELLDMSDETVNIDCNADDFGAKPYDGHGVQKDIQLGSDLFAPSGQSDLILNIESNEENENPWQIGAA